MPPSKPVFTAADYWALPGLEVNFSRIVENM